MEFHSMKSQLTHWHDRNKHQFHMLNPFFEPFALAAEAIAGMKPHGTMVQFRFKMLDLNEENIEAIQEFSYIISGGRAVVFHTIKSLSSPIPELIVACEDDTGAISAASLVLKTIDRSYEMKQKPRWTVILHAIRIVSKADSQFFKWCIANGFDDAFAITLLHPFLSSEVFNLANRNPLISHYLDSEKRFLNPLRWHQILAIFAKQWGWTVERIEQLPQEAEDVLQEEESSYIRFIGGEQIPALFKVADSNGTTQFHVSVKPSIISRIFA